MRVGFSPPWHATRLASTTCSSGRLFLASPHSNRCWLIRTAQRLRWAVWTPSWLPSCRCRRWHPPPACPCGPPHSPWPPQPPKSPCKQRQRPSGHRPRKTGARALRQRRRPTSSSSWTARGATTCSWTHSRTSLTSAMEMRPQHKACPCCTALTCRRWSASSVAWSPTSPPFAPSTPACATEPSVCHWWCV